MKKVFVIFVAILLSATVLFTGCANDEVLSDSGLVSGDTEVIAYDFEPLTFYSFDDFVDAIVNIDAEADMHNLSGIDHYYIPAESIKNISLDAITVKERYVCLYYYLDDLTGVKYSSADDAEIARISNTIKLEWTRKDDGETLLSNTI